VDEGEPAMRTFYAGGERIALRILEGLTYAGEEERRNEEAEGRVPEA
jgi:hypothetical protein